MGIIGVLMIFAVVRRRADMETLTMILLLGGVLLGSVLNIFLPVGFGEKGVYFNGRLTPFGNVQYFNVERETTGSFTLRLRTKKREVALDFKQEEKPLVLAWMDKGKIPDMETCLKQNDQ